MSRPIRYSICHPDQRNYANGLCRLCYQKEYRKTYDNSTATKRWYINNRNRMRDIQLQYLYGLTPERYDEILLAQGGHCKFCDKIPFGYKNLFVDHDHVTGKIRGIVCNNHNNLIAFIENNRSILDDVMSYLSYT